MAANRMAASGAEETTLSETSNEEKYLGLRRLALESTPASMSLASEQFRGGRVFSALMEFAMSGANVTLFCSAAGGASLYTSRRFGVIGGFAHDRVRLAAQTFISLCDQYRDEMASVDLCPPPKDGELRIYALTCDQIITTGAAEAALVSGTPIAAIRAAGHAVIAELRQIRS